MTQRELDLKNQELRLQYKKKSNEIKREKDAVQNGKMKSLVLCDEEFHAKRRKLVNEIRDLTSERFARAADDPKREELLVRCKMLENEISLLRFDNAALRDKIICQYGEICRQLDEKHRQLSAWYEEEKLRAMREYIETEKQNPIEEVKVVE